MDNHVEQCILLYGQDLVVYCGGLRGRDEVWFYRPIGNSLLPALTTHPAVFQACIEGAPRARVFLSHVREVRVDGAQALVNLSCAGVRQETNVPPYDQRYVGRGDVWLELRADVDGAEDVARRLLDRLFRPSSGPAGGGSGSVGRGC